MGAPFEHYGLLQTGGFGMPVRSLSFAILRWPNAPHIDYVALFAAIAQILGGNHKGATTIGLQHETP
ncbi:MAG TPA: hypothetical protein VGU64_16195 [Terriglobales bacterium]|nr:hypothetical protein [Terriglobales bacterium]